MDKDIAHITKNNETEIIVRIDDFGGRRGLTIREFVKSERYTGFTKAGTRISAEHFQEFKDAINSIDEKELMMPSETKPTPRSEMPQRNNSSYSSEKPSSYTPSPEKKNAPKAKSADEDFAMDETEF